MAAACTNAPRTPARAPEGAHVLAGVSRLENGVRTVEFDSTAFARAPADQIGNTPLFVIGGGRDDAAFDLTDVYTVTPLASGEFVALDPIGGGHLMLFAANGKPKRMLARPGQGPGDLMSPSDPVRLAGDTLYLEDDANNRINWITARNGVVRTAPIPASASRRLFPRPVGLVGSNQMVSYDAVAHAALDTVTRAPVALHVSTLSREHDTIIDSIPGIEMTTINSHFRGVPRPIRETLRFGQRSLVAVWDTLIAIAAGDRGYGIDCLDAAGVVRMRIHVAVPRRAVSAAMRNAQIRRELDQINGSRREGAMVDADESRREARENPFADSLPPYSELLAGPRGVLWVLDGMAPGDTAWNATAFRADGAIIGRLHAPLADPPVAFESDRAIVRHADANGVVSFPVYQLSSP